MTHRRWAVLLFFLLGALRVEAQGKMSLDLTKTVIELFRSGTRTEEQTIKIIESRGVDFPSTESNLAELSKLGASLGILETVRRLSPVPTGSLDVRCVPAECDFAINGRPVGKSVNGRFILAGIPVGDVVVDVSRAGYIGRQVRMKIAQTPSAATTITLAGSPATKMANGKRLFEAMVAALGATARTTEVLKFAGNGAATVYLGDKQRDWTFAAEGASGNVMAMRVASPEGTLDYTCAGQTCELAKSGIFSRFKSGKKPPDPVSEELQVDLRAFSRFNFISLLRNLMAPSIQFSADEPSGTDDLHLFADAGDLTYDVVIGADQYPVSIGYLTETGLGSGLKVTFGQYRPQKNGLRYPMRTSIRLADSEKHGIEVRFDNVDIVTSTAGVPKN